MTYELVHFAGPHRDELFNFRGDHVPGRDLAVTIRRALIERLTGEAAPYNGIFTTNGIACTTATLIAAALGYREVTGLTTEQVGTIERVHLLLAMFNALQPGVFAISGWDLCGMLTLPEQQITDLLSGGDTRWLHRGAYDLMDFQPYATASSSKIPRGTSLYGCLPRQLKDPASFVSRLATILRLRTHHRIATAVQLAVPATGRPGVLAMIHRLDTGRIQATVLNFSGAPLADRITCEELPIGAPVIDMFTDQPITAIGEDHGCAVTLGPYQGTSLLLGSPS
jgi:trehalose synthase